MEQWLVKKYGKDDDSYLDRLEEYERMMVAKYDLRLPQVTEPKEVEFFSIEDDGQGGKQIHVWGYTYTEGDDQGDGPWRNVEYTGFIEPLQEFIDHLNAEENYVDNHASLLTQYIGDYYDDGIVDIINHYFNGETANDVLRYSENLKRITTMARIGKYDVTPTAIGVRVSYNGCWAGDIDGVSAEHLSEEDIEDLLFGDE